MSTIIIGDIAEGQKWWGVVANMKAELLSQFSDNNAYMSTWKQLSPDVKVHIKMVGNLPQAFIYVDGGYEFYVPMAMFDPEGPEFDGVDIYNQMFNSMLRVLIPEQTRSIPCNIWYNDTGYVTAISGARYRNFHNIAGAEYQYSYLSQSRHFIGGSSEAYRGQVLVAASAIFGKYMLSIQPGNLDGPTVVFVEDMTSKEIAFAGFVTGTWPKDSVSGYEFAHGPWVFDRSGKRACSVIWVPDRERFGATGVDASINASVPYVTSWIIELTFEFDDDGEFLAIYRTKQIETEDFCIAVDYNWQTEENEMLITTLVGYDYRIAKAGAWSAEMTNMPGSSPDRPLKVGDHLKTTRTATTGDTSRIRPGELYAITGIMDGGIDITLEGNSSEFTPLGGGVSINDIIKVTEDPLPTLPETPAIQYYKVTGIPTTPPESPPAPVFGEAKPEHTTGAAMSGNVQLTALNPKTGTSKPHHKFGIDTDGDFLLECVTAGNLFEWQPSLTVAKYQLLRVSWVNEIFGAEPIQIYYRVTDLVPAVPHTTGNDAPTHLSGTAINGNVYLSVVEDYQTAMDEWLVVRKENDDIVRSIKIAHNADPYTGLQSNNTWYQGADIESSYRINITGMDFRVGGITAYSTDNGSNYASLYDREWNNDVLLPECLTMDVMPGNYYYPNILYQRIKIMSIAQTIAAIPSKLDEDGTIRDACIYAPYVIDEMTGLTDPDQAIDIRIDWLTYEKGKAIMGYHRDTFTKLNDEEIPYNNRFFASGAWAKRRVSK